MILVSCSILIRKYYNVSQQTADVNECLLNPCHVNADCNNTDGSFYCYCQSGYLGDGFQCTGANNNNMPIILLGIIYIVNSLNCRH